MCPSTCPDSSSPYTADSRPPRRIACSAARARFASASASQSQTRRKSSFRLQGTRGPLQGVFTARTALNRAALPPIRPPSARHARSTTWSLRQRNGLGASGRFSHRCRLKSAASRVCDEARESAAPSSRPYLPTCATNVRRRLGLRVRPLRYT